MNNHDNINPSYYKNKAIQPIDFIEQNNLSFNEGNIIKYVVRWKEKNGIEDLKKAQFYLNRLIISQEKKCELEKENNFENIIV